MKTFNKMSYLPNVNIEEKLLFKMQYKDKKTQELVISEKNALMYLAEHEAITGCSTEGLWEKWKANGTLVKNGKYTFKCTLDLSKANDYQKVWKLKVKTNPNEAHKAVKMMMTVPSFSLSNYVQGKVKVDTESSIINVVKKKLSIKK